MRDVASLAGVGVKTVSRVVNDEGHVSDGMRRRVQEAAGQLGYRHNRTASILRRADGRTATIGLLLEDVANPFSATLLRAVEDVARERGVQVLIASLDEDADREREFARALVDRQVDGLLVVPTGDDQSHLAAEHQDGKPVVFVDRVPHRIAADTVLSDNRDGAARAVAHLLARGHRRIAYLGDAEDIATAQERHAGYVDALVAAGLEADPGLARHGVGTIPAAFAAAREVLGAPAGRRPTAVFASQNLVTMGVTKALHHLGLHHEVALVGFDDFPLADVLVPGVSLVAQDPAEIGRLAASLLFARLDGEEGEAATHRIATRLVERGSGEIGPPR